MILDRERFLDIWSRCGGEEEDRIFDEIETHYREPHRHYHTTAHIVFCLNELDKAFADIKLRGTELQHDAVELSIWFHDVVLEIPGANNEQKSAQLFLDVSDGRLDNELRNRVHDAIIATTHKTSPDVLESQLTVDIDLSGLAQSWPEFFVDSRLVRAEFSYLSDKEYTYKTETEKGLEKLKKKAEEEKYFSTFSEEYDVLVAKMQENKNDDLQKSKDDIKEILTGEIMSRYYYQKGRIKAGLNFDIEVEKAIEILQNKQQYNDILKID